ncbi:hypothetical protein Cgig2_019056 [Carnegiea gigantea]|uniref:Uncharacterized protein n=1 Tax=Carnegiea gigantea TaxID=171969 RepID=A0A9Q1KEY5_9CARY|nr:hypothetical protein Cgig2_019056 [Carnegiea gigantea]
MKITRDFLIVTELSLPELTCKNFDSITNLIDNAVEVQGLGELQTGKDLCGLLRRVQPSLVFLSETEARVGGLALLWVKDLQISLLSQSPNHIDRKASACEYILPVVPNSKDVGKMAYHFHLLTMIKPHGKERTKPKFQILGKAVGFEGFRVACLDYDFKLMEFIQNN